MLETYFDENGSPTPAVGFRYPDDDIGAARPDRHREFLATALGLLLTGCDQRTAQARLALLDGLLNPSLRPSDLRLKWPGLRKSQQDNTAREFASLLIPISEEKKAAVASTGAEMP